MCATGRFGYPVLAVALMIGSVTSADAAGWRRRHCPPCVDCPPSQLATPSRPAPTTSTPAEETPSSDLSQTFDDMVASSVSAPSSPQTLAPNMLGDLFGTGGAFFLGYQNGAGQGVSANNLTPVNGGRRLKMGEAVSPMPRNRVFFSYNLFRGPYRTEAPAGGVTPLGNDTVMIGNGNGPAGAGARNFDLNRFTFGIEKTFFNDRVSTEVRIPFSHTLDPDLLVSDDGTVPGMTSTQIDNVSVSLKGILHRSRKLAVSGGLVINVPSASGVTIQQNFNDVAGGTMLGHIVDIRNDAVHFGPFLGYLITPNDRLFLQGFVQYDFGLSANQTFFTPIVDGVSQARQDGLLNDQSLMQFDVALGYWVYRNPRAKWIRGFAPIAELHYTTTTDNADLIPFNNAAGAYQSIVGNTLNRLDIINMTVGSAMQVGDRGTLSSGVVLPLNRGDHNFLFDWEFQLQLNYRFGKAPQGPDSPIYN